jgi:hypothetical protein
MTRAQFSKRCHPISFVVALAVCALLVGAVATAAGSGYASNGVSASIRSVQPAVSGLFQVHTPRVWTDAVGEAGAPGANGVPVFLDTWEAFGARTSSAILKSGYAFTTVDALGHSVLYAGVQRTTGGGAGNVSVEFSQKPGQRLLGDLRISADIDAAGTIGSVRFEGFTGEGKGGARFLPIALLPTEGCNDAGTACAVSNGTLVEFGYNLTVLGKPEKDFSGIQITTPEESVVGLFSINPVELPIVTCPSNLTVCTANDVTTTVKGVTILNNDLCSSLTDTIQLQITTAYAATSNERFDLGLFVSGDGGTVKEPSTALVCRGAAAQVGQGDNLAYPDADTDLFLSIDPTGHSSTPSTTDTCGDLRASAGPVDWTVTATVDCNIVNGELRIPSCRVWEQNANHKVSCQTLQQAGTGSKCDCTDLVVTAQLNPCATTICNDNNACTTDSCTVVGTAPNATAQCVFTNNTSACDDNNACTLGESCSGGSCAGGTGPDCNDNNPCTTDGCSAASGCTHVNNTDACSDGNACTVGDVCSGGACVPGAAPNCDDNNVCTNDSCNPATGCAHSNNSAACDDNTICNGREICSGGSCGAGTALNCDDNNVCTNDSCDPVTGCAHTNNTATCDDNTVCNGREVCSAGSCRAGTALDCNDNNVCTDDSCNPASGCVNANNTGPCTDNNQCTGGDHCSGGVCVPGGTPVPIPDNYCQA